MRQDVYETFASREGIMYHIYAVYNLLNTQQLTVFTFTGTTYNVLPHT